MWVLRLIVIALFLPYGLWAEDKLKALQENADSGNVQAVYE